MTIFYVLIIGGALLFWPLITGIIAQTFGRNFWTWFFLGLLLPFVSMVILHCLSTKKGKNEIFYDMPESDSFTLGTLLRKRVRAIGKTEIRQQDN